MKLEPIAIDGTLVPTRYFFAPLNTGFVEAGTPSERLIEFHSARSGNGIGLSYVGNVAIGRDYVTNQTTPFFTDGGERSWHRLVEAISVRGSVPAVQIGCRFSGRPAQRKWLRRNEVSMTEVQREIASLSSLQLKAIVRGFSASAQTAMRSGFQVIQVHAAHGYLLSLFMSSMTNRRTDAYGKDPLLLTSEVIEAVGSAAPGAILDVRISARDGLERSEIEFPARGEQIAEVTRMGAKMISLSSGMYDFSKHLIYPSEKDAPDKALSHAIRWSESHPGIVWNVAGNIRELDSVEAKAPRNLTFALCRPLIADPEYVAKYAQGRHSEIRLCDWRGRCHYYTRGTPHVTCPVSSDVAES